MATLRVLRSHSESENESTRFDQRSIDIEGILEGNEFLYYDDDDDKEDEMELFLSEVNLHGDDV